MLRCGLEYDVFPVTTNRWRPVILEITQIAELLAPEMEGLEREMIRILESDQPFLAKLNQRVVKQRGKRLRPKLLILCSKMVGYQGPLATLYASVYELIHTATLIHDDIIDGAQTRRGRRTLNSDLGNTITVLFGDLLFTRAYRAAVEMGRLDVLSTITEVTERMVEGELLQHRHNFDLSIQTRSYFDILERKTAFLFGGTTKTAGLIGDCSPEESQALYDFGYHFGVSFQLIDDYLDYMGSQSEMGKPVLSDLKEGKVTLPIIKLLQKDDGRFGELVERYWREPGGQVPEVLLQALKADNGLDETWQLAKEHAEKAVAFLEPFPDNEYAQILRELPFNTLYRKA